MTRFRQNGTSFEAILASTPSPKAPLPACGVYDAGVNPELESNVPSDRVRANSTGNSTRARSPDALASVSLTSLSLEEIEAEIARRRSFSIESLLARRKELEEALRAIVAEIAAIENDAPLRAIEARLRAMTGKAISEPAPKVDVPRAAEPTSPPPKVWTPPARPVAPAIPVESALTAQPIPSAKPTSATPTAFPAAPVDRVVADTKPNSTVTRDPEPVVAKVPSARAEVDPTSRPPSLSRVVLETVVESKDVAMSLREITAAVQPKLQRDRPDLERAVAQVIGDLRGKGAIEATGFEIYVATESGRRRLLE